MKSKTLILATLALAGVTAAFYPQQGTQQHNDLGGCRVDIPTNPITEAPRFVLQAHWGDKTDHAKALAGVKITFIPPESSKLATANFDANPTNKLELHVSRDNYALLEWIDPDSGDDYLKLTLKRQKNLDIANYDTFEFRSDKTPGDADYQYYTGHYDPLAITKRPSIEVLKNQSNGKRQIRIRVEFAGLKSGFTLLELP